MQLRHSAVHCCWEHLVVSQCCTDTYPDCWLVAFCDASKRTHSKHHVQHRSHVTFCVVFAHPSINSHILQHILGQMMNIADVQHHPLWNPAIDKQTGFSTSNILCCPISDGASKNIAVLEVGVMFMAVPCQCLLHDDTSVPVLCCWSAMVMVQPFQL